MKYELAKVSIAELGKLSAQEQVNFLNTLKSDVRMYPGDPSIRIAISNTTQLIAKAYSPDQWQKAQAALEKDTFEGVGTTKYTMESIETLLDSTIHFAGNVVETAWKLGNFAISEGISLGRRILDGINKSK